MSVPTIKSTEPVFPTPEATESVWVTLELYWDDDAHIFTHDADNDDWVLDEYAFPESFYEVEGTRYESLPEARRAALGPRRYRKHFEEAHLPGEQVTFQQFHEDHRPTEQATLQKFHG